MGARHLLLLCELSGAAYQCGREEGMRASPPRTTPSAARYGWRRGWDSKPRTGWPVDGFQVELHLATRQLAATLHSSRVGACRHRRPSRSIGESSREEAAQCRSLSSTFNPNGDAARFRSTLVPTFYFIPAFLLNNGEEVQSSSGHG
jgi:hypothetical protein